jgi:lysophospholipase L1-like esterase
MQIRSRLAGAVCVAALGACALRLGGFALAVRAATCDACLRHAWSRPVAGDAPVMLVLGDSLAVGLGATTAADTIAGLIAADYPGVSILNRARAGTRTAQVRAQLAGVASRGRIAAVWISAGGNDVIANTPLPALRLHLRATLRASRAVTSTVVVTSAANIGLAPLFFWPLNRVLSLRTRRVRDLFASECASAGAQFVDFFHEADADPFSRDPGRFFGDDGVHPSAESYRFCYAQMLARTRLHAALSGVPCPQVRDFPQALDGMRIAGSSPSARPARRMTHHGEKTMKQSDKPSAKPAGNQVEGEGSYSGARQYDEATREFLKKGKVEQAARDAAPKSGAEAAEMDAAEEEGRSHAKE